MPIDVCYELVGHLRMLWRGFDGGQDVRARPRRVLRPGAVAQPAGRRRAVTDLAFEVLDVVAAAARGRAAPAVPAAGHRDQRRGGARDRAARPAAHRAAAPALRRRRAGRVWPTCSARGPLRDTLKPFLWTHASHDGAGLRRLPRVRPAGRRAPTTSRSAAPIPPRVARRRRTARPAVQRHRFHPRRAPASRSSSCPWSLEASLPAAGRGLARADGPLLPGQRLDPAGPRHHRRPGAPPGRARPTSWEQTVADLLPTGAVTRPLT